MLLPLFPFVVSQLPLLLKNDDNPSQQWNVTSRRNSPNTFKVTFLGGGLSWIPRPQHPVFPEAYIPGHLRLTTLCRSTPPPSPLSSFPEAVQKHLEHTSKTVSSGTIYVTWMTNAWTKYRQEDQPVHSPHSCTHTWYTQDYHIGTRISGFIPRQTLSPLSLSFPVQSGEGMEMAQGLSIDVSLGGLYSILASSK